MVPRVGQGIWFGIKYPSQKPETSFLSHGLEVHNNILFLEFCNSNESHSNIQWIKSNQTYSVVKASYTIGFDSVL